MRQESVRASVVRRVRQRSNLVLVGLLGGMFCLLRITDGPARLTTIDLALPFLVLLAHLTLSPVPWQWTGDDAPRADFGRGFLQAVLFNGGWVFLFLMVMWFLEPRPPQMPFGPPPPREPRPPMHGPGPGLLLINVAFATAFGWVFADKEALEARERDTAERLREAQARALQSQLDPHVLYNALSSLSELVYEDPLAAEDVITRLADLYRRLMVHGHAPSVRLGEERQLVEAYLAMEAMRLGDRLTVAWDWPDALEETLAPPLLLQPLVENAIKHGIAPTEAGGELRITGRKEGHRLRLEVANTGQPLSNVPATGIGLTNLRARLTLWEDAEARLDLDHAGGWTRAVLTWRES